MPGVHFALFLFLSDSAPSLSKNTISSSQMQRMSKKQNDNKNGQTYFPIVNPELNTFHKASWLADKYFYSQKWVNDHAWWGHLEQIGVAKSFS